MKGRNSSVSGRKDDKCLVMFTKKQLFLIIEEHRGAALSAGIGLVNVFPCLCVLVFHDLLKIL